MKVLRHERSSCRGGPYHRVLQTTSRLLCGLNATTQKSLSLGLDPPREEPSDCCGIKPELLQNKSFFLKFFIVKVCRPTQSVPRTVCNTKPHLCNTIGNQPTTSFWKNKKKFLSFQVAALEAQRGNYQHSGTVNQMVAKKQLTWHKHKQKSGMRVIYPAVVLKIRHQDE